MPRPFRFIRRALALVVGHLDSVLEGQAEHSQQLEAVITNQVRLEEKLERLEQLEGLAEQNPTTQETLPGVDPSPAAPPEATDPPPASS